ncbi:hypothetical protein HanIR_Chr04g0188191 [Helianthus annuus]|nr:hypothetical protein HanIR_Chr04g0188191 [Helianthus annuus]
MSISNLMCKAIYLSGSLSIRGAFNRSVIKLPNSSLSNLFLGPSYFLILLINNEPVS